MQSGPTDGVKKMQYGPTGGVKLIRDETGAVKVAQNEMTKFGQSKKRRTCSDRVEAKYPLGARRQPI